MSCEHEVRFTIKPTDDACRFHFDVRAYKDRIVAPDEYSGVTAVTPSHIEQVLPTKDKLVREDITVLPAPTEYLSTDHNGTFTPSDGKVGFYQVDVDVNPDLRPLSVSENGTYQPDGFDGYSSVTADIEPNLTSLAVTENGLYLPESGTDGFDRVSVDVPTPAPVTESLSVTENGTYVPSAGVDGFNEVVVDVPAGGFPSYDDVVLPSEYQRVEYIESSGTQFIELPIGFYPTDEVSIKGVNPNINSSDKYLVSPKRWNNDDNRFAMFGFNRNTQNTPTYILGYGNLGTGHTAYTMPIAPNSDFHRFYYANRISVCPDLAIAIGVANVAFGSETANLKLFYGYNSNTAGKICYYIHKKADGRKLALYACYRKSDGVIGMYDVENDVFYTNDGSGDFTKGQDI